MKLSDYVAEFIVKLGVKDIFLISGGGMMHLLDSVGKNEDLNIVCNLNEQASSICADSYGQYTNNIGVCMLTTGPGGTNAVTGIAASYLDSTSVLAISGQVKTADAANIRGVRQFGAQEVDIVSIVKPITKYAVTVTDKESIRFHLEKAVYLALNGRKGPVWLDIPLDIQAAQIEPEELEGYYPEEKVEKRDYTEQIANIYQLLVRAKRPVILVGAGGICGESREKMLHFLHLLGIPVLTTWRAKDLLEESSEIYYHMPGIPALRYPNFIIQNADLVVIIGTRLNPAISAYDESHFAFQAKKVIVDIDRNEIEKLDMDFEEKIVIDSKDFLDKIISLLERNPIKRNYLKWFEYCNLVKQKYPLSKERQQVFNEALTDGYLLAEKISNYSDKKDIFVGSSSGRTCGISHMGIKLKKGQRFISSMGLGSMGFVIPSAIACCMAAEKRRIIALEGDGSLQHNIQELQVIKNYNLPIKLFILSNSGYASIYTMQKNNFSNRFVACNSETKVAFPDMRDIAKTYGLKYFCINNNQEIDIVVERALKDDKPVLCEVKASINFDEIPKSMTIAHPDGTFSSSKLENLFPFLSKDETKENMPKWE